jgi:GNAT superfamily N-acetyltransferase
MSSTELGTALRIRPYVPEDEPAVLALLVGALGEGPSGQRTPDFFRWKHLENPFGESLLLVAELDDEIVGLRAFLRWGFTVGDRSLRAVRAVDTATREDQRGKGIFSTLTKAAVAELRTDTDLVFNTPNGSSRPGYLKMGWQEVGRVPVWIKVRRPVSFARGVRSATSVNARPAREITVTAPSASDGFGDDTDLRAFLSELGHPAERLATPYSSEYLTWRYAKAPLGYRAIVARTAGRIDGIAIFRVRPRGTLWEATIADLLVRPDDRKTAAELIDRVAASADVDHLTCHFATGSPQLAASRRRMFLRSPRGELILTVNPLRDGLEFVSDFGSWAVSAGTLEVF